MKKFSKAECKLVVSAVEKWLSAPYTPCTLNVEQDVGTVTFRVEFAPLVCVVAEPPRKENGKGEKGKTRTRG